MPYETDNIARIQGYVPGEQPSGSGVIKLNTNENPYPASPLVAETLAKIQIEELKRYPSATAREFCQLAAKIHGINPENLVPTNGGDELLRLALTTFVGESDTVAITTPSYSLYPVLANLRGCSLHEVPLQKDLTYPENLIETLCNLSAKICILVNPHAPTGALLPVSFIDSLAGKFKGVLIIDEAYADFVDPDLSYDSIPLIRKHKNLLFLRTLSKGYSLAGLRFGYGIGDHELIAPMLFKTRDSYNTDYVSQKLASAALKSKNYAMTTWEKIRSSRIVLAESLSQLGLKIWPSQSNFILAQIPQEPGAKNVYHKLKADNILVRHFDVESLSDKIRITIGSEGENKQLISSLKKIIAP